MLAGIAPLSYTPTVPYQQTFHGWMCRLMAGIVALSALSGCDSATNTFLPPPPDGLTGGATDARTDVADPPTLDRMSTGLSSIELILDHRDSTEIEEVKTAARVQAGIENAKLRIAILADSALPASQVNLVCEAVDRAPSALVIELADPTTSGWRTRSTEPVRTASQLFYLTGDFPLRARRVPSRPLTIPP